MGSWLKTLGLDQYIEIFHQNAIDGMELSSMTGETLANDLGIGKLSFSHLSITT